MAPTLSSRLYAVVEAREGEGIYPHIYRTRDDGKVWTRNLQGAASGPRADAARAGISTLTRAQGQAAQLFGLVENADLAPTPQVLAAWKDTASAIDAAIAAWERGGR